MKYTLKVMAIFEDKKSEYEYDGPPLALVDHIERTEPLKKN